MKESKELTSAPNVSIMDEEKGIRVRLQIKSVVFLEVARLQPGNHYSTAPRRSEIVIEVAGGLIIIITRHEPSDCNRTLNRFKTYLEISILILRPFIFSFFTKATVRSIRLRFTAA